MWRARARRVNVILLLLTMPMTLALICVSIFNGVWPLALVVMVQEAIIVRALKESWYAPADEEE